jgi:hypothetical protein
MSQQHSENTIITGAQKVLLTNGKGQNNVQHLFHKLDVIRKEFVPEAKRPNNEILCTCAESLPKWISRVRPQF